MGDAGTLEDIQPLFPGVTVNLAEGPQDSLSLIARVSSELRCRGFVAAADAFEAVVGQYNPETHDDLVVLIRSTVTVL